jgi:hypothetical protein
MSSASKRQIAYGAALIAGLIGFALFKSWPGAQAVFAVASVAVLAVYVVRSDEVERALGVQAGAAAFVLLLAAALVLAAIGQSAMLAAWAGELWAVMVATALVCWAVLRIRLG